MSKHTPGPWTAYGRVIRAGGRFIARTEHFPLSDESAEEQYCRAIEHANASLIAAAPELLEACKAVFDDPECIDESTKRDWLLDAPMRILREAIQKAEAE